MQQSKSMRPPLKVVLWLAGLPVIGMGARGNLDLDICIGSAHLKDMAASFWATQEYRMPHCLARCLTDYNSQGEGSKSLPAAG